ncbi:unnamed protein product, partial [Allacma fusca]
NEGLHHKLWIPRKEFRKTSEGRIARSTKRKAKRVAAWASKIKTSELGVPSNIDMDSNCDETVGIVGVLKNLQLEEADLSTALNSSWLNNFLIDFYAELLITKFKPYGSVYFPTEFIATISNFGDHWIVIIADKKSLKLKIVDTLR